MAPLGAESAYELTLGPAEVLLPHELHGDGACHGGCPQGLWHGGGAGAAEGLRLTGHFVV